MGSRIRCSIKELVLINRESVFAIWGGGGGM